jgi:hypothetical protein
MSMSVLSKEDASGAAQQPSEQGGRSAEKGGRGWMEKGGGGEKVVERGEGGVGGVGWRRGCAPQYR